MYYDTHLNISLTGDEYNLHSAEKPYKQDGDDPPIELQTLPSDLKYIYLDDLLIILLLSMLTFQRMKRRKLEKFLEILKKSSGTHLAALKE